MRDNLYVNNENKFKKGYLIYLGILFAICLIVLAFLWIKLKGFQETADEAALLEAANNTEISAEQSQIYARKCFADYADNMTLDSWVSLYYQSHPEHYDKEEDVKAFITENILSGQLERFKASDYTEDAPKFVITRDNEPVASFILSGNNEDWAVTDSYMLIHGDKSFDISAPADITVTINGYEINNESADISKNAVAVDGYDEDLVNPVIMNNYQIRSLLSEESEVVASNAYLSVDGNFYSISSEEDLKDKAESFIMSLLKYYSSGKENTDAHASEVLSHVQSASSAAKIINAAKSGLEWVVADHSSTYEVECSPTCKIADNCCFVDVSYNKNSEGEDSFSVYRVYFLDSGDGYKIVLFEGIK